MASKSPIDLSAYRKKIKEKDLAMPDDKAVVYICGNCQNQGWFIVSDGTLECANCGEVATNITHNG